MDNIYPHIIQNLPLNAAEGCQPYRFLTERHIQAIWFEQKYFKDLITTNGETVQVISPGIWNADAGPDFRKAHLKIGSREFHGDVEIHLLEDSWYQHQHHLDENYNHVVLHVSLWQPRSSKPIQTQSQAAVCRTSLENSLTIPQARIAQLINLDLYPYKKFVGSGRCAHSLFRSLPAAKITSFFQKAADWRLVKKRTYLKSRVEDKGLLFPGGIAMTLGYKNNAEAFLDLYLQTMQCKPANEEECLAILIKLSGFFNPIYALKWSTSSYYHHLHNLQKRVDLSELPSVNLSLKKTRPLNHPLRRLAFMAKMICDSSIPALFPRMARHWERSWQEQLGPQKLKHLQAHFKEMLPVYTDSYWNHHYTFEEEGRREYLPLIGNDLKNEILVNVLLPLLEEQIAARANVDEMEAFHQFYCSVPASNTSKTKYLVHRFFGDMGKGSILKKAYMEQGAYQLHHDFCIHYEASCEGCPFVERYQTMCANN